MSHEALLWDWMHEHGKTMPGLHWQRIENGLARGTPDVEGCYQGRSFWIELKAENRPKRETTPIRLPMRIEQVRWLAKRHAVLGSCWVYVRVGLRTEAARYLIRGNWAHQLLEPVMERDLVLWSELGGDHTFQQLLGTVA